MTNNIKILDKEFSVFISATEIEAAVDKVAQRINTDLKGKNPLFIVILNGAFMFASDLMKKITLDCEVSFVKLSSYVGTSSSQNVKKLIGINEELHGRSIIIVEDIIDTGLTMEKLIADIQKLQPDDIRLATCLFKPNAFQKSYPIDYVGIEIPNDFIVGYGLDYDGYGRNYPEIYKIV
jgi:hypoxanthine phosphoribosyltransferase